MDEVITDSNFNLDELSAIQKREQDLMQLIHNTGFDTVQENGQRKIGGPPPNWCGPPPPKGCEIFVGKLPRNVFEQELYKIFSTVGTIYELRLMMDFSGTNRGFAFITYTNYEDASRSIELMNGYELRPRHHIGVVKSIDNCRLFVGGIPKFKTQEEVRAELERMTEGVAQVIVYSSITDKTKNRGFAFVEYVNHRAASKARRKLIPDRVTLWGKEIAVDWALPETQVDEEIMSRVTVLYVRNLNLTTTEQMLRDLFNSVSNHDVQKVKMMRDFAFVHFSSRESAQKAMEKLNSTEVNGSRVEVTWAKPVKDKESPKVKSKPSKTASRKTSLSSVASSNSYASSCLASTPAVPAPATPSQMIMMQHTYTSVSPILPMGQSPNWYSPQFPSVYSPPFFPNRVVIPDREQIPQEPNRGSRSNEANAFLRHPLCLENGNLNTNRVYSCVQNRGVGNEYRNYTPLGSDCRDENTVVSLDGLSLYDSPPPANLCNISSPGVAVSNINGHFMNRINENNNGMNHLGISGQFTQLPNTMMPPRFSNYTMRPNQRVRID